MNISRKIIIHGFVWVLIALLFFLGGTVSLHIKFGVEKSDFYFSLINIAVFYANYAYLIPFYLSRKKYILYIASVVTLILLSGILKYGVDKYFLSYPANFSNYYIGVCIISLFFIFLSSVIRFASDWFVNVKQKKELENQKLQAELAFLRSQVNPHFLFNSLNNIYSLAYQKSEKAPEAILKLSEIMRYMLDEKDDLKVDLEKEIKYLSNYIQLQKLRFSSGPYIEFNVTGKEYQRQKIAPLILISFIENAFKHGDATDASYPVKITLQVAPASLQLHVSNKKSKMQNKDTLSGIGIKNVQKRLQLLYPNKYKLKINESEEFYNCELSLDL